MSPRVQEEPFTAMARRINAASTGLEKTFRDASDVAVDDGREMLRGELMVTGAPDHVIGALRTFREQSDDGFQHAVGVPQKHPAAQAAIDYEYGAADHSKGPAGTFRMTSPQLAEWAAEEVADVVGLAVLGG